ncbi:hypothetical protein [Pseudomonas nunensis]|uniref:hypothetical protein n=1 Tax=Pseudomonas nunensis TaxID=2961896 RepID=UPI000B272B24|nr:hypothetical protein [Pseudomonas nunensis]
MIRIKLAGFVLAVTLIQPMTFAYANEEIAYKQDMIEPKLIEKELAADKALRSIERRTTTSLLERNSNVRSFHISDDAKMTIGVAGGKKAIEKLVPNVDIDELNRMIAEARHCEGEQKELSVITQAQVRSCFINSSEAKSEDLSYLESFRYLSSLVDTRFRHKCIVSVFGDGVWITAGHCVPKDFMKYGLSILVDGRFVELTQNSVRQCSSVNCDIAFISIKTPSGIKSGIPKPVNTSKDDYWNAEIIVPGLPQGTNVTELRDRDNYTKALLWGPVGQAFCRIIKDPNNGCIVHGCSTLTGFSGSPLYQKTKTADGYELAGIHSGTNLSKEAALTDGKCDAGISINYASRMKGEGF